MTIETQGRDVRVTGELDMFRAAAVRKAIDAVEDNVILDLTGVEFIDSAGIGALLAATRRLKDDGRRLLVVTGPDSSVRRVLDLSGVSDYLDLSGSRWQAVNRLPG